MAFIGDKERKQKLWFLRRIIGSGLLINIVICTQQRNCQQLHLSWGINFSSNKNFKVCKSNLKDKVRLSLFATRRYLEVSKIPLDITNKLFNSLFILILHYASEVWGIYEKDDFTNWKKDIGSLYTRA